MDEFDLLGLSPIDFEHIVRDLLLRMGYKFISQPSGDAGVDFVVSHEGVLRNDLMVVVAKRWRTAVGASAVRELAGTLFATKAQSGLLVTTGSFTQEALGVAEKMPITLIDGPNLLQLLRSRSPHDLRTPGSAARWNTARTPSSSIARSPPTTSAEANWKRLSRISSARFSAATGSLAGDRVSTPVTSQPCRSSSAARCEPMNPATPVINARSRSPPTCRTVACPATAT
jgi:hypothetical protein